MCRSIKRQCLEMCTTETCSWAQTLLAGATLQRPEDSRNDAVCQRNPLLGRARLLRWKIITTDQRTPVGPSPVASGEQVDAVWRGNCGWAGQSRRWAVERMSAGLIRNNKVSDSMSKVVP